MEAPKPAFADATPGHSDLSALLQGLPTAACTVDADGLITFYNEAAKALWGREPRLCDPEERYCGSYRLYSVDGEPIPHAECWMALALRAGTAYLEREIVVERPDGQRRKALAHARPLQDSSGRILGGVNYLVDITREDRHRLRRSAVRDVRDAVWSMGSPDDLGLVLQRIRAQLGRQRISYEMVGVTVIDPQKRMIVAKYLSRRDGEVDGWSTRIFDDEKGRFDLSGNGGIVAHCFDSQQTVYRANLFEEDRYGEREWIDDRRLAIASLVDVPFSHGTLAVSSRIPAGFSGEDIDFFEDLADVLTDGFRRLADLRALEQRATEAEELNRTIARTERLRAAGELSAGVCHNLNNLLTGIIGPARMLRDRETQPNEDLDLVVSAAERARDLVHKLHMSVRDVPREALAAVDLRRAVEEAVQVTRPRWKDEPEARDVHIDVVTDLAGTPPVRATEHDLHSLLGNLIYNAVDALPEGGRMTIASRVDGDTVELSVSDDGIGMDEATRSRVFEPFFTSKADVGTGLGLATVYDTINRWGGRIDVDSEPGIGTTFRLWLPVWSERDVQVATQAASLPRSAPPATGRVLLIDDEDVVRRAMGRLLKTRHDVDTAASGREGLHLFEPGNRDVVFLDLGLGDIRGDSLAAQLRERDPHVALGLITGWDLSKEDPRRAPFDAVLSKPVTDLEAFLETVEDLIDLARRRRAG